MLKCVKKMGRDRYLQNMSTPYYTHSRGQKDTSFVSIKKVLNKDVPNNVLTFYTRVTKEKPEYWGSKEVFFTMPVYGFFS